MFNRLDYLKIFCVAAQHRTFKDAAIKMNISPQVVTRCIKELEAEVGEILFVRSTRNIKITTFGEQFLQKAQQALVIMDDVFSKTAHDNLPVKITAPPSFARPLLIPVLAKISKIHPEIQFDLRLSNQISDVVEDKIDIGIRAGNPITDNRFVARAVNKINHVVVATPELIAHVGKPETIDDLNHLPVTTMFDNNRNQLWEWFFKDNQIFKPKSPVLVSDDADAEFAAILNGMGFGQVSVFMAGPYIRKGLLIPVLNEYEEHNKWNLYIYRPQRGPVPPRVRIVFDELVKHMQDPDLFPQDISEVSQD